MFWFVLIYHFRFFINFIITFSFYTHIWLVSPLIRVYRSYRLSIFSKNIKNNFLILQIFLIIIKWTGRNLCIFIIFPRHFQFLKSHSAFIPLFPLIHSVIRYNFTPFLSNVLYEFFINIVRSLRFTCCEFLISKIESFKCPGPLNSL